jgi:hypothetical protein
MITKEMREQLAPLSVEQALALGVGACVYFINRADQTIQGFTVTARYELHATFPHTPLFYTEHAARMYLQEQGTYIDSAKVDMSSVVNLDGKLKQCLNSDPLPQRQFPSGAVRDTDSGKPRPFLIPPEALESLGRTLAEGAKHYGERNWEKGMPLGQFFDSMLRHYIGVYKLDHSEDHLAKMFWNAMCLVVTVERIKSGALPKELDDIGWTKQAGKPHSL